MKTQTNPIQIFSGGKKKKRREHLLVSSVRPGFSVIPKSDKDNTRKKSIKLFLKNINAGFLNKILAKWNK